MSVGNRVEDRGKACGLESLAPLGQVTQVPKTVPWRKSGKHERGEPELRGLKSQMACFFIYGAKGSR